MNILVTELEKSMHKLDYALTDEQYIDLKAEIETYVASIMQTDVPALVQLLYKIDVDEQSVALLFSTDNVAATSKEISKLIVQRQLKKAGIKKLYSDINNIEDDERW